MSSKELALQTIQELPDDVEWPEIEERIRFLAAIECGLEDVKHGRVVSHEDVKSNFEQWLTK